MGQRQSIPNTTAESNSGSSSGIDSTYHVSDMLKEIPSDVAFVYNSDPSAITKEDLPVKGAFLLHNVLSQEECEQFIQMATAMGFEQSPLRDISVVNSNYANLTNRTLEVRNSERVLCDMTTEICDELSRRIEPHLPAKVECRGFQWEVVRVGEAPAGGCINKRWRFNRYIKGGYFRPHYDAGYKYSRECETLFTFILYLNQGFEGGETKFFPRQSKPVCVVPKIGTALVFFQTGDLSPLHEGSELLSESPKLILRSDLAYKKITE
jgi:prolyl 4-hydroxylase